MTGKPEEKNNILVNKRKWMEHEF